MGKAARQKLKVKFAGFEASGEGVLPVICLTTVVVVFCVAMVIAGLGPVTAAMKAGANALGIAEAPAALESSNEVDREHAS